MYPNMFLLKMETGKSLSSICLPLALLDTRRIAGYVLLQINNTCFGNPHDT